MTNAQGIKDEYVDFSIHVPQVKRHKVIPFNIYTAILSGDLLLKTFKNLLKADNLPKWTASTLASDQQAARREQLLPKTYKTRSK